MADVSEAVHTSSNVSLQYYVVAHLTARFCPISHINYHFDLYSFVQILTIFMCKITL